MAKTQQIVPLCVDCVHVQPGTMTHIFGEDHGCGAEAATRVDPVNGQPVSLGCRAMRTWGPCGPNGALWTAAAKE